MKDILLVEDNEEIAALLKAFLERAGYFVHHAVSGEDAVNWLKSNPAKLMILDIMLPGIDGFAVCRAVREQKNIPILIMSARAGREDKLNGYELGADDYIEKPVDADILVAKVNALLQRAYGTADENRLLVSGDITLDLNGRKGYWKGEPLELNVKEYELLRLFLRNPGKTLRKEYIFAQIWGADSFSESQTLTVHIKMLRSKIEENPRIPKRIQTVWGVGYRYEEL